MPNRPLSFPSLIKSALVGACVLVGGCDMVGDPPTQLEAQITVLREPRDKDALMKHIVDYLAIKGLAETQFRLRPLEGKAHTFSLRLVGKEAVPAPLLEQLAKALAAADKERTWSDKLSVDASEEVSPFLQTTQREFPLVMHWERAEVDAYVVHLPVSPMEMLRRMQEGGNAREKKTALCMLSFAPNGKLPKLEGTYKEVFGREQVKTMREMRATTGGDLPVLVPHAVTFEQAALAEAFGEPLVKDGKIMFQFAVIDDARVTEIGDVAAVDHQGNTQKQCQGKLEQQHPAINQRIKRAALLSEVESIGPARLVPLRLASQ